MIAFLIAWALIGVVFFVGIVAEKHGRIRWCAREFCMTGPAILLCIALWPVGCWNVAAKRGRYGRG